MDLLISWMPSRNYRCYKVFPTRTLDSFIVLDFFNPKLGIVFFGGEKPPSFSILHVLFGGGRAHGMFLACSLGEGSSSGHMWVFREE